MLAGVVQKTHELSQYGLTAKVNEFKVFVGYASGSR